MLGACERLARSSRPDRWSRPPVAHAASLRGRPELLLRAAAGVLLLVLLRAGIMWNVVVLERCSCYSIVASLLYSIQL